MIKTKGLCKQYTINDSVKIDALKNVNLEFSSAGFVVVAGRSGSGKTTLLNMLGGLDKPSNGSVYFEEKNFDTFKAKDFDYYRNYNISFIFQDYNLLSDYTVIENIKLAVNFQEKNKENVNKKASEALEKVGLIEFRDRKLKTLSGGQQQRVVIARALAKDASVILCDEPTGNLDSKTSEQIIQVLKEIAEDKLVIVVTHDEEIAKNADRLIRLKDGEVAEDLILNEISKTELKRENKISKKNYGGISLKASLAIVKHNLLNSWISSSFIAVLFLAVFVLLTLFTSLAQFDKNESYAYTLKENGQYVMQITKYIDQPRTYPNFGQNIIINGPGAEYSKCKIEDINALKNQNKDAAFYPSYFFNKNFQDFTDSFILPSSSKFVYEAIGFREAVAVDDFSAFHQELSYGRKPEETNEVLIYDYMAYSLLYHNVFSGSIREAVGKELIDKQTGLLLRISGIIKSDYEQYNYLKHVQTESSTYRFEKIYLTSLQTIFCRPEFIKELEKEFYYSSLIKLAFINKDEDILIDIDTKKFKFMTSGFENLNYLAKVEIFEEDIAGLILTAEQAAQILGIEVSELTEEKAEALISDFNVSGAMMYYNYSLEASGCLNFGALVIGISTDLVVQNSVVCFKENEAHLSLNNSSFRQIYLSLTQDWKVNSEILGNLVWTVQGKEFYAANPDYYAEGYFDFNAYSVLITKAAEYLDSVGDFAVDMTYILIVASIVGIFIFTFLTVRKYNYKIGVLKSLGAKNRNIVLIFGLQLLLTALAAFILSVPISIILMGKINSMFASKINSKLTFFFLNPISIFWIALAAAVLVAVSALIPIIKLAITSPTDILKNNNRK